jgi:eukaryotic-like serine/threonine-protein kinase
VNKLGKYELIHELGRGGMGIVYRARDPIINRLVALKTITTGVADYPNLLQRFYREAQSAGGLQHPNIVTIYDMGEESGTPYIAMELIEGETLEQLIAGRPNLPLSLKLTYAIQACRAFDYAHKRGIVHRDIKPANVMLSKDGTVKVVDFGIARVLESSKTQTGMLIGTFAYMSPEQYHGEHADERSDIWSFGILLFELLTYQKPFSGDAPASLMHSICHQDPLLPSQVSPECPPELDAVMRRVLQKSPAERCQSMEDLLLELDPICKSLQSATVAKLVEEGRELVKRGDFSEARDLLRQALQVESTNIHARSLLEKVNAELKRVLIRPKAQQMVDKGLELLAQGKIQEARVEAENALKLDTNFEPAQQLKQRVQQELDRFQLVAEHLDAAKLRLAEGLPEMAEALLQKVLELEPNNRLAKSLQEQVANEKAQRERRLRLLETMQRARSLWTLQNYQECIELLTGLAREFPQEDEVLRLLYTAREDLAEQHKQQTLEKARILLASGRHEECIALLVEIEQSTPGNAAIGELLESARQDQANQRRLQGLAEARRLFAGRQYAECISLLATLQREYPADPELGKLMEAAREDQLKQDRQQRIAKARNLLAARRYEDCRKLLTQLKEEFPADEEIAHLLVSLRDDEAEQSKLQGLAEARGLLASRRYDESLNLLNRLQKQFPGDGEISRLIEALRADQAEQRKLRQLAEARNLLADKRYDEAIPLLTSLQQSFPREGEVAKLLDRAHKDRAERQKREKLAEARAHLAAGRPGDALTLLEPLRRTDPNDTAVQKLLDLVRGEQERQSKLDHLQREWEILKNLVNEKKYPEVIARAEKLLADFPADSDLLRLVEFARARQTQLEREALLRKTCDSIRKLCADNQFQDAARAATEALKTFPDNKDLLLLLDQAEVQEKKLQTRKAIEQRIRDIRVKINREKFSEAVWMAKETLATLGPDTGVTQLLNSAQVEIAARDQKRKQEEELESIRLMIKRGELDGATQALTEAIAAETLANFDPRVRRVSDEIEAARNQASATTPPDSGPPHGLSKEYAWEGPPPPDNLDVCDGAVQTQRVEPQVSPSSPVMSSAPAAPAPPAEVPPLTLQPPVSVPEPPAAVKPPATEWTIPTPPPTKAAPPPAAEPAPPLTAKPVPPPAKAATPPAAKPVPQAPPRTVARPASSEPVIPPAPISIPLPVQRRPPVVAPPVAKRQEALPAVLPWKRPAVIGVIALILVAAVWFGLHGPATKKEIQPSQVAPPVATRPPAPVVNPLEVRQREAIDAADKRRAAGDLSGASQLLQSAAAINGPLSAEIQKKQTDTQAEINDARLGALRQKEEQAWQNAKRDVDGARFSSAEKYLRSILALPEGGLRKADAQKYLNNVIPQRKKEETLFAQAQRDSQKGDLNSIKDADDVLPQVIQIGGPRKSEAEQLRQSVQGRLATLAQQQQQQLQQQQRDQQIADLRAGALRDLALGDFSAARQKMAQMKQAGADTTSLSAEIDKAEAAEQAQQYEANYQKAVQKYKQALAANDKNGMSAARDSFLSIVQGNGARANDARTYVSEINDKITASAVANATPPVARQGIPSGNAPDGRAVRDQVALQAEKEGIQKALDLFNGAVQGQQPHQLKEIWPSAADRYLKALRPPPGYKVVFLLQPTGDPVISGETAVVPCDLKSETTGPGGQISANHKAVEVRLRKAANGWLISDPFGQ